MAEIFRKINLVVHVEGVGGILGGSEADGTAMCLGLDPDPSDDPTWDFEAWPGLAALPEPLKSTLDPKAGTQDLSSYQFRFVATPELCRVLGQEQARDRAPSKVATFTDASSNYIEFERGAADNWQTGQWIWIGSEAIVLGWKTLYSDRVRFTDGTRGAALTVASDHPPGRRAHDRFTARRARLVRMLLYVEGEEPVVLWTGLLTNVATKNAQSELVVTARELMQSFKDLNLGDNRKPIQPGNPLNFREGRIKASANQEWIERTFAAQGAGYVFIQLDDLLYKWEWEGTPGASDLILANNENPVAGQIPKNDDGTNKTFSEIVGDEIPEAWEILAHLSANESSFEGAHEHTHFASQVLSLLVSTGQGGNDPVWQGSAEVFDVLGEGWGLGLPAELIDYESFRRVMTARPDLTVDRITLGESGDAPNVLNTVREKYLRSRGYFIAQNRRGQLSLRHLGKLSVLGLEELMLEGHASIMLPEDFNFDWRLEDSSFRIKGQVGGDAFREGVSVTANLDDGTRAERLLAQGGADEYDFSTFDPGRVQEVINLLTAQALGRRDAAPVLEAKFFWEHDESFAGFNGGEVPSQGQWMRIHGGPEGGIIGPDGERVQPSEEPVAFTGILVGQGLNLNEFSVSSEVLLPNWALQVPIRLIAPTAKLLNNGYDGNYYVTLYAQTLPAVDNGQSVDGPSGFMVGDDVEFRRMDGRPARGFSVREVTAVDNVSGFIYLNASAPAEIGYLMELRNRNSFSNDGWPGADFFEPTDNARYRRYAYLAGPSGSFGSEPADVYDD